MKNSIFYLVVLILIAGVNTQPPTVVLLPNLCMTMATPSTGQIILGQQSSPLGDGAYPTPVPLGTCNYTIVAANANEKIRFGIGTGNNELNMIFPGTDGNCTEAGLSVFDSDQTTLLRTYCGVLSRGMDVLSAGDQLTISFFTIGGATSIVNFTSHYTSFSDDPNCASDPAYFPCSNGNCISPNGFICDSTLINNCGDFSDNSRGPPGNCSETNETTTQAETTTGLTTTLLGDEAAVDILVVVGAALGGILGAYALYWLLWKPGYLVWRCSCWRHWCRNNSSSPTSSSKGQSLTKKTKTKPFKSENGKSYQQPSSQSDPEKPPNIPTSSPPNGSHLSPSSIYGITREPHIFL